MTLIKIWICKCTAQCQFTRNRVEGEDPQLFLKKAITQTKRRSTTGREHVRQSVGDEYKF